MRGKKQVASFASGGPSLFPVFEPRQSPNIDGVSDSNSFEETVNAFTLLGFTDDEQNDMFKILAAILHLGNIVFEETIIQTENEQDQEGCGIRVRISFLYVIDYQ